MLPPSLKRVFENGPILRPFFLCRIVPNSAIFCQNAAEYGIKSTFFATDFMRTGQALRLGSHPNHPNGRRHKLAGRPKASERPTRVLPEGGHRISRAGRGLVTDMVKPRRLTKRVNRHFHHPYNGFGGKRVLQTNGLLERVSVSGRFGGCQILPNFTNFYQKCVAKGGRRGSKRQLTRAFSRAILLKRVKSRGSCQGIIGGDRRVWPALP